jgi:hypothetical protein
METLMPPKPIPDVPPGPGWPGTNPGKAKSKSEFVTKDKVLDHLKNMPSDSDGLLIVSPLGQDVPDDYAQLAMYINPDYAFQGSSSFVINATPGSNDYDVLDLNNLPVGVEVQLIIRSTDGAWRQSSTFRGTEGNIQGAGESGTPI